LTLAAYSNVITIIITHMIIMAMIILGLSKIKE